MSPPGRQPQRLGHEGLTQRHGKHGVDCAKYFGRCSLADNAARRYSGASRDYYAVLCVGVSRAVVRALSDQPFYRVIASEIDATWSLLSDPL